MYVSRTLRYVTWMFFMCAFTLRYRYVSVLVCLRVRCVVFTCISVHAVLRSFTYTSVLRLRLRVVRIRLYLHSFRCMVAFVSCCVPLRLRLRPSTLVYVYVYVCARLHIRSFAFTFTLMIVDVYVYARLRLRFEWRVYFGFRCYIHSYTFLQAVINKFHLDKLRT